MIPYLPSNTYDEILKEKWLCHDDYGRSVLYLVWDIQHVTNWYQELI